MARPNIDELFKTGINVYRNDKGSYVLELWGGSTKYPDSVFHFEDFEKNPYLDDEVQVFQWLCECASKLSFPFHAKNLIKYALENWCVWESEGWPLGRPAIQ